MRLRRFTFKVILPLTMIDEFHAEPPVDPAFLDAMKLLTGAKQVWYFAKPNQPITLNFTYEEYT